MTAITGINNNAQSAWTEKPSTRTAAAADDAALFRLAQEDASENATTRTGVDNNETAALQRMVETAMASMQPSSTVYSSSTVSLSDGTAEGTISSTDQTVSQRYDLQQLAQQVLRQYDQVSAGGSSSSATGNTISKVA